jgi:hypothetical protein
MSHSCAVKTRAVVAAVALFAWVFYAGAAEASPPSPELMAKLADYAAKFEAQKTRATYAFDGKLETRDSDDKHVSDKELVARIAPDALGPKVTVVRYTEDGHDKTADAVKKAAEAEKKRADHAHERHTLKMPIGADEQPRYVFDVAESDGASSRVRITFTPKTPAEDTIEGSAWVDETTGDLISAGFKLSKRPMFVDYVHVSVEFGARTSLGPAVSDVKIDGRGGLLFYHRHFLATAHLSDYRILP